MMLNDAADTGWMTEVLWIPVDQIQKLERAAPEQWGTFKRILLEAAWRYTRYTHAAQMRAAAIYTALYDWMPDEYGLDADEALTLESRLGSRKFRPDAYIDQTIQHLINISRGATLGFVPLVASDESGPFHKIQALLAGSSICRKNIWQFPAILRPSQLNRRGGASAVYYSFQEPTVLAPVDRRHEDIQFMQELNARLRVIKKKSPDLLNDVRIGMYRGLGGQLNTDILPFQSADEVIEDFRPQYEFARKTWKIKNIESFFPGAKNGFMSRFIRLAIPKN
jgi:hypothetical protein